MDDNSRNKNSDKDWDKIAREVRAHEQRARVIFENLHTAAERENMTTALANVMSLEDDEWLSDYLLAALMLFDCCDTDVLPILNKKKMLH
jgi:hypothetical protein